jgi:hypothetical protein
MRRKLLTAGVVLAAMALAGLAMAQEKAAAPTDGADYKGVNTCKMCHNKAAAKIYDAWAATKHAKAFANLKAADDKTVAEVAAKLKLDAKHSTDDACVQCHVTGFKAKTGYPQADSLKNAALANVTCEACHGPGSKHTAAPTAEKKKFIAMPTKETCLKCHTPEMSPKFDFDAWKVKVHAVAAAAK